MRWHGNKKTPRATHTKTKLGVSSLIFIKIKHTKQAAVTVRLKTKSKVWQIHSTISEKRGLVSLLSIASPKLQPQVSLSNFIATL
ncbi:hypothetical protein CO046_04330 [Candidatus Peregrinibacteria bacterium CG_4_9_14_0_2_um_filter_53_11]|nr:MAG: hypothetical protein CO046_04330 [Candidatus Peregrinibacteria bacterium CG_4_9_14_0_2_um_filter_53_11]